MGGIETVSALLAEHFQRDGHGVVVVTQTAGDAAGDSHAYRVVRRPATAALLALVRWADVILHNNISLRFAWPLVFLRRPWVVAHHTWIPRTGLAARAKRLLLPFASHIAVSHAIADDLPVASSVLPNPYADDRFQQIAGAAREGQLVFVGRLVSDKGVDVLLDTLGSLRRRGRQVRLTIIGDGPEEQALRRQASKLGIAGQVEFAGRRVGTALVDSLNAHQVLVMPSMWEEPFGVVALEAMACGCVPLVARSGGLPDAVGAAGRVVPRGDREALANAIEALIDNPAALNQYRAEAAAHLARHTRERVAREYLRVLDDAHRSRATHSRARAA